MSCPRPARALLTLVSRVQICRKWKESPSCPLELQIFAGKRVIGALAGRLIRPIDNSISPKALAELWKGLGYVVLLPSGEGMGWESSCHFTVT